MAPPLRPRVVMLPGLDGGVGMSGAFLQALRTHGLEAEALSLPVVGGQDYSTLCAWLQPQLPQLPWVLLGESFAGPLALAAAWPLPPLPVMARVLLGQWRSPENVQSLRQALVDVPNRVLRQRAASTLRVDVRALLPRIAVPTLCLQARQDRLLWPPSVAELQALLPTARHMALQGPHLLLQARPEQAAEVVARWVNGLPPASRS